MESTRRLPVYLLLDVSGSMTGDPIESVRQGLKALLADLHNDPMALETAYLSVITFGSTAQQVTPLLDIATFTEPVLSACGATAMGAALKLLRERIADEVHKNSPTEKGDFRPLVFLMSDGQPTDDCFDEEAARTKDSKLNIIACAAGSGASDTELKKITDTVIRLASLEPDQFRNFFKWVSGSIAAVAKSVQSGPTPTPLPPTPGGIIVVP